MQVKIQEQSLGPQKKGDCKEPPWGKAGVRERKQGCLRGQAGMLWYPTQQPAEKLLYVFRSPLFRIHIWFTFSCSSSTTAALPRADTCPSVCWQHLELTEQTAQDAESLGKVLVAVVLCSSGRPMHPADRKGRPGHSTSPLISFCFLGTKPQCWSSRLGPE